ncbi:hypothetical protein [Treponema zioleckii]|uniref:hypothetical protein n=1 Tax=Treponema zioleckii TaxID=331680 RepID=UPI00168AFEA5|nr:hypothetical protein [Treponema zioleckii]
MNIQVESLFGDVDLKSDAPKNPELIAEITDICYKTMKLFGQHDSRETILKLLESDFGFKIVSESASVDLMIDTDINHIYEPRH